MRRQVATVSPPSSRDLAGCRSKKILCGHEIVRVRTSAGFFRFKSQARRYTRHDRDANRSTRRMRGEPRAFSREARFGGVPRRPTHFVEHEAQLEAAFLKTYTEPAAWSTAQASFVKTATGLLHLSEDSKEWPNHEKRLKETHERLHTKATRNAWIRKVGDSWELSESGLAHVQGRGPSRPPKVPSAGATLWRELSRAADAKMFVREGDEWWGTSPEQRAIVDGVFTYASALVRKWPKNLPRLPDRLKDVDGFCLRKTHGSQLAEQILRSGQPYTAPFPPRTEFAWLQELRAWLLTAGLKVTGDV